MAFRVRVRVRVRFVRGMRILTLTLLTLTLTLRHGECKVVLGFDKVFRDTHTVEIHVT